MDGEKVTEFLTELTELTKKYGIQIAGCGCCGSPWLEEAEHENGFYVLEEGKWEKLTYAKFQMSDQIRG